MSRAQRARERRAAKAALHSAVLAEEEDENGQIEIEQMEAQVAEVKKARRAMHKENWEYFVSGLPAENLTSRGHSRRGEDKSSESKASRSLLYSSRGTRWRARRV